MSLEKKYEYPLDKSRYNYPTFSPKEYERRYDLIRKFMRRKEIECLLIAGGTTAFDRCWSNIRYVTNYIGSMEHVTYCVFPLEGEPIVASLLIVPSRIARSIVEVRASNPVQVVVERLKELKLEKCKIGIVEPDVTMSIPLNHWTEFSSAFPEASMKFVTEEFWRLRLVKSDEEIKALERAAGLGDIAVEAIATKVKPAMKEGEVYGIYYNAVLSAGGEPGFPGIAATSMKDPDDGFIRVHPMNRTIKSGDLILMELGPLYNGYEAQNQKSIALGELRPDYREMYDLAMEAWYAVRNTLRPGMTDVEIKRAGDIVLGHGYINNSPYVHWMHGGMPREGPLIGLPHSYWQASRIVLEKNMCPTVEIALSTPDRKKGVVIGDTFRITDGDPVCLHKYPSHNPAITVI